MRVRSARRTLSQAEIIAIAELGLRAERHSRPQDLEWARADGASYLVQSRPITTHGAAQPASESREAASTASTLLLSAWRHLQDARQDECASSLPPTSRPNSATTRFWSPR